MASKLFFQMNSLALRSFSKLPLQRKPVTVVIARSFSRQTRSSSSSAGVESSTSWLGHAWHRYTHLLNERPLTTKASIAALIFFCSDSATQYVIGDAATTRWDPSRAASGAAFGVVATGWLHYWWGFLEYAVGSRIPAAQYRLANTLAKVFVDQAVGAVLYIYTYYMLTNTLRAVAHSKEGTSPTEVLASTHERAADMLWPTMLQHWKVWPVMHTLNFYYIPLHHRVLVQNIVLVGWSGYLSHLNNGGLMTPDREIKVTIKRRESQIP